MFTLQETLNEETVNGADDSEKILFGERKCDNNHRFV